MNKAIILIAGMGTRLKPLTEKTHKCMTAVCGKPILINMLDILSTNNISESVLVVGYLADTIKERIGYSYNGMEIRYILNDVFSVTNTSYSLRIALEEIRDFDNLYILEGDVFFDEELFDMLNTQEKNVTLIEAYNELLDGSVVEIDESGYVIDWVHKSKRGNDYELSDKYKTINIHRFSRSFVEQELIPTLREMTVKTKGTIPIEDVLREIVKANPRAIRGVESNGIRWYEIDDENDLKLAESIFGNIRRGTCK